MGNQNCVWVVFLRPPTASSRPQGSALFQHHPQPTTSIQSNLNETVHQLWSIESFGTHPDVKAPISRENARSLKLLEENVSYLGKRYEAPLLWKMNQPNLPDNYAVALSRFHTQDRSWKKSPLEGPVGLTWYLPHHAVFHPDKPG
jgi:hypothetical protein